MPSIDLQSQSKAILDQPVSLFQGAKAKDVLETIPLGDVLHRIQNGTYRTALAHVRTQKTRGAAAYRKAKEALIAFTPCCAMRTRAQKVPMVDKLLSVTGVVHYDFDHVEDVPALKARLASNPATVFAFTSPGGDGLKVGIAATGVTDADTYKHPWQVVLRRLKKAYPDLSISEDEHVKFLHALCFVSDDPDIYVNADAVPLDIPVQPPDEQEPPPEDADPGATSPAYSVVSGALATIPNSAVHYDTWLTLGMALHSTGQPWARALWDGWSQQSPKFDARKQETSWRSFTKGGGRTLGDLYTLASKHGWRKFSTPVEDAEERTNGVHRDPHGPRVLLTTAEDVVEEELTWLWDYYLPLKMASLVDGDPGVGKTLFGCQLATNVTRGFPMPDQYGHLTRSLGEPRHVLMVAMEDHLGSVVRPRLRKAGADLRKITFVLGCEEVSDQPRPFTLADLPLLSAYMEQCHPRLVYIDAIQSVLGPKVDINRANAVTSMLAPLKTLAERYDCAIVCNRHPAKEGQNSAKLQHRGLGSQAFVGTARAGLFIEEHPADTTQALIIPYKSNAGKPGRTQVFSKARGVFEWVRASRITQALLTGSGPGPSPRERVKAALWLEDYLRPGEAVQAGTVYQAAEDLDLDYSKRSLRMAAEALGVEKKPIQGDYLWTLPPLTPPLEEDHEETVSSLSSLSSMRSMTSIQQWKKEEAEDPNFHCATDLHCDADLHDDIDDTDLSLPVSEEQAPERPVDPVDPVDPDNPDNPDTTADQALPRRAPGEAAAKEAGGPIIISRGMTTDLHAHLLEDLRSPEGKPPSYEEFDL